MRTVLAKVARWLFRTWSPMPMTTGVQPLKRQGAEPPREHLYIQPGYVSIENNQIIVTDPDAEGPFATLTLPSSPWVTVTFNGKPKVGTVVVRSSQELVVTLHPTLATRTLSHTVSADNMSVTVRVQITPGKQVRLKEVHQVHHAVLEMMRVPLDPPPLDEQEILTVVQSAGYQGNLDEASVTALAHATQTVEQVVLRGRRPVSGQPPRYRPVRLPQVYDPVHRRMEIPSVRQGTTVAIFEPAKAGSPGVDVFGKSVAAPQTRNLPVLGEGVMLAGERVIALRSGRLLLTKSRIDVVPELIVQHDLTGKEGRLEFDGNVRIVGSVLDGGFIQATGHVTIQGSVLNANVLGEQGVFVGSSIVGSQVVAGQSHILYAALHQQIKDCLQVFTLFQKEYSVVQDQIQSRLNQLGSSALAEKGQLLADLLINQRHPQLQRALSVLAEDQNGLADLDDRYREIVQSLRKQWLGAGRTNIQKEDVLHLQQLLTEYKAYLESTALGQVADIKAASISSSSARCTGKILVTGAGVYNSVLEAKNSIVVRGTTRGGRMTAGQSVDVHELGAPYGTNSTIKVLNPNGKIAIQVRHLNTLLQVGNVYQRNLVTETHVLFNQAGDSSSAPAVCASRP
ncbi:DUF342 domain-containing protein [Alicyclobacillaceae bacterium I2511]|nr:DUF342 domain-containing protein [Alicyclobacillaceae bacterium I2511]